MYDYEDYYNEPSEFDEKCNELIDLLRENANSAIKAELEAKDNEIKRLKTLNEDMKAVYDNYQSKVKELEDLKKLYEWNEKTAQENVKQKLKQERLGVLLEDFYSVLYIVVNDGKEQPKCNRCDSKGFIHYKTPLGKDATERCSCREKLPYYSVQETDIVSFNLIRNKTVLQGMFRRRQYFDDDWFERTSYMDSMLYKDQPFESLDRKCIYFSSKDKAQEYADWLNSQLPIFANTEV